MLRRAELAHLGGRDPVGKVKHLREEIASGKCYISIKEGEVVHAIGSKLVL